MSKEVGIALVIVGAIGAVIGVFLMVTCTATFFGTCVRHDYSAVGILAGLGSGAMLVVGFVLLLTGQKPAIQSPFAPSYAPPVPPIGAATTQGAPPPTSANPCSVCDQPLAWIQAQNRWYCSRCGAYR